MTEVARLLNTGSDLIRGRPRATIVTHMSRMWSNPEATQDFLHRRLDELASYVGTNIRAYQDFPRDFWALPVVTKQQILSDPESYQTPFLPRKNITCATTSGTTGVPFEVQFDATKRLVRAADLHFFGKLAGYRVGQRLYRFTCYNSFNPTYWQRRRSNTVRIPALHLDDNLLAKTLRLMSSYRGQKAMLGFASSFDSLADFLQRHPTPQLHNFSGIIAVSEPLKPATQQLLSNTFQISMVSRYGSEELGILAQQLPGAQEFRCNEHSFYLEILNDDNQPVAPGQQGRVVVTDLFNRAMPLVRYDTGDLATLGDPTRGRMSLAEVAGRAVDQIFDTSSRPVSRLIFYTLFDDFRNIKQYRLTQSDRDHYELALSTHNPEPEPDRDNLGRALAKFLGTDAHISIHIVPTIPPAPSGKQRVMVSQWHPNRADTRVR